MRRKVWLLVCTSLIAAAAALHATDAASKPAPRKGAPADAAPRLPPDTVTRLRSGDESQIKAALDDVRTAGTAGKPAAGAIADLLDKGMTTDLTVAALDALGDAEADSASKTIAWYAVHRNAAVRQAAVKALARTKGPIAIATLRHALSDGDQAVRGIAAAGLGTLKAKEAVGDLFVALDHRVGEAAASIGQLCQPSDCEKLEDKLGKLPFDIVTGGLDQILFRPLAEIDDDMKVKLVGRVRELGTAEGNKFLRDVQKRWPAGGSSRVKQAIDQGVLATAGVSP
jgi:hypothetical protein